MQIAYIGMGGNIASPAGPPEATLSAAAERLSSLGRVIAKSSLYSTAPVGVADQPRFVNAVLALETHLGAHQLLEGLLRIEREFGRDRSAGLQNGPRTLDLDLLLLGDEVIHDYALDLPHPRLAERAFVLIPLNEIAPNLLVVTHGKTVKQLLHSLKNGSDTDAVLPLQNHLWRAVRCRDGGLRAGETDAHRHR